MPEDLRHAAHAALAAGLSVVPPREDGSKAPLGEWKRYQTSRPSPQQVEAWYARDRHGIGLICGAISGNLELLEFETEEVSIAYLEAAHVAGLGPLVDRIEAGYLEASPAGGTHWLYHCSQISGNTKLAREPGPEPSTIKVLIETRGEGGYVVCAPSHGPIHPTGKPYRILQGSFDQIATITPTEREELHRLARSFDRAPEQPRTAHQHDQDPIPEGHLSPGDDYNRRAAWPDLLEPTGWTLVMRNGQLEHWRRPGKQHGISATIQPRESDEPTLKVFSTSTPFDTAGTHSKFDAYTLLEHGGDHHAAAKALYALGYGEHLDHHGKPCVRADCPNPPEGIPKPSDPKPASPTIEPRPFDHQIVNLAELARAGVRPPDLVCGKLLYRGALHSLAGPPDSGKSTLLYYWTVTLLAAGHTVILLDEESGREATTEKLLALGAEPEHLERLVYVEYPARQWDAADVRALQLLLGAHRPALLGFDSSAAFLAQAGKDENAAVEVTDFYKRVLLEAARSNGCAVVILDHLGKDQVGGRYARGSGAKLATVDVAFMLDPIKIFNRTTPGLLKVTITKDRRGYLHRHHEVRVEVEDGQMAVAFNPVDVDEDGDLVGLPPAAVKILEVLRVAPAPRTVRQIVDDVASKYGHGLRRNTVSSMLQILADRRLVDSESSQNGPQKLWWATNV